MVKNIKLTKEELRYLGSALDFYCDETTHDPEGEFLGINPNLREGKVLDNVRKKINSPAFNRGEVKRKQKGGLKR